MVHKELSTQHNTYNVIIRWIVYLAGKDDHLLDGPGGLVLQVC